MCCYYYKLITVRKALLTKLLVGVVSRLYIKKKTGCVIRRCRFAFSKFGVQFACNYTFITIVSLFVVVVVVQ